MTQPDPVPRFPTSLGTSTEKTITLLGQDLAADLMGKVGFGELALWLVTQRRPTAAQVRVFEAVLVALADHGFTPTAMAARLTYLSAPDSVQGALAAGLLGGGSRFLGVTEDACQFLSAALAEAGQPLPADDAGWDALAVGAITRARAAGKFIPGLGHPVHKVTDPRTPVLIQIAEEEGLRGPHLRLFEAIGRVHPQVLGRTLPLNGAGTCGAALADLGLPPALLRGFALLARAAGLLGQIAEEQRRPVAHGHVHDRGPQHRVPSPRPRLGPAPLEPSRARSRHPEGAAMATVAAVIASTHHPFYYRASTSTGADRPPFADEWVAKIGAFRETLTRARPDVLVMVGSDHFHQLWLDNMPQFLIGKAPCYDANWYNEEREFGLPRMFLQGHEELSGYLLREGMDAGFDLAFSNELRIDHSITCPLITLRPEADLPIVPIYTNIFAPPMPQPRRFVELGRAIREMVEAWPSDKRVAIIGTGHLSLELGGPRQFGPQGPDPEFDRKAVEWISSGDLDSALAQVSLDSLWQPGNATHGFMDFMLMMGAAGAGMKADYSDSLDLFHTMEAYFTWYPEGAAAR